MGAMSKRIRSFQLVAVIALLSTLLPAASVLGGAAPAPHPASHYGLAQSTDGSYPSTVVLQGEQFLFDRIVPVDPQELVPLEEQGDVTLYARSDAAPFPAIYAVLAGSPPGEGVARYLPTNTNSPDSLCPAENAQVGSITSGDQSYAFAGIETDIPAEALVEVANADGQPVYADPDAAQPAPELLVASDQGLMRFILMTADGVPMPLAGSVTFGDHTYAFSADVTDSTDPSTLAKIGCTGPFPAYATIDAQTPTDTISILVNGRYLSFNATGAASEATTTPENTVSTPESGAPAEATSPPITDTNASDTAATATSSTDEAVGNEIADATPTTNGATGDQTSGGTPTTENQDNGAGLAIELSENVGTSGQPEGLPREIRVGAEWFQFDRIVALSAQGLAVVAQQDAITVYASSDQEPFDTIFLAIPNSGDGSLARYLPERTTTPDTACPMETASIGLLQTGDASYAFAGIETDLSPDALQQIGDSNGSTVYADPGVGQPVPEIFIADPSGLLRFMLLNDQGLPAALSQSLVVNGAEYALVGDVTDQTDRSTLPKAGCAGPFPVYASVDDAGGNVRPTLRVGGRTPLPVRSRRRLTS